MFTLGAYMKHIPKRILVCDDDEHVLEFFRALLRGRGYDCISASNGKEALEMLHFMDVDLLLSDVSMPVMDGFELLGEVRKDEKLKGLPVFLYSGFYTTEEGEAPAMKAGANRFFGKPFDVKEVLAAIEGQLVKEEPKKRCGSLITLKKWKDIVDPIPEMLLLIDNGGTILAQNKALAEMFGYVEGKKCCDIFHCREFGTDECLAMAAFRGKNRVSREILVDGRWLLEVIEPIKLSFGEVEGLTVLVKDVTEEKEIRETLIENERRYHSLFENALDGIVEVTRDGGIILSNPSFLRMLGYESFDDLTKHVKDVEKDLYVRGEDRKELLRRMDGDGRVYGFETQFKRKDGSTIWVRINAYGVKGVNGSITRIQKFVEDITERKKAENELKLLSEELRRSFAATIRAMSGILELRDPYTYGHQRRVSRLARAIAQTMGLPREVVENVRTAGLIHDIGKILVPAEILNKPGRLNELEMELIKKHAEVGYKILRDARMPDPIPDIAYQHHERLDGSGYPRKLVGEKIMVEARIIAVADVVEAMVSHRPYRPALGIDAAIEEIKRAEGRLYDRSVVEACIKVLDSQESYSKIFG